MTTSSRRARGRQPRGNPAARWPGATTPSNAGPRPWRVHCVTCGLRRSGSPVTGPCHSTATKAERSLRMAKILRNVGGCLHSEDHARHVVAVRTCIDTVREHGVGTLHVLGGLPRSDPWSISADPRPIQAFIALKPVAGTMSMAELCSTQRYFHPPGAHLDKEQQWRSRSEQE